VYGRRRSKSVAAEGGSGDALTTEEEARLQRLIAEEPLPDNPA
jgi:hypothetical protein